MITRNPITRKSDHQTDKNETRCIIPQFSACKKRQLKSLKDVGREVHVEIYLRTYKFCL